VNLVAQFWRYLTKVFELPRHLRAVRDTRLYPDIPTSVVSAALFFGAVLRLPSFRQMAKDSARSGWRRLLKLGAPLSDDVMAYVVERYRLEDWREILVSTNKTLKRNRAFESAKMNGLLVVSIDANEQFNSQHRCCEACSRRKIKVRNRAGQEAEVDQFYHRMVYASIQGPQFGVVLDVEPIRPGEDEAAAALRMLGRMRRLYGPRFFDVVTVDAWYTKTPFIRAVRRLGWGIVSVFKQERYTAYQEASTLAAAQKAECFEWEQRQIALRQIRDLTLAEEGNEHIRVVLADENWIQTNRIAGRTVRTPMKSHWRWIASPELDPYPAQVVWRIGHQRWAIENHVFNELTQHYHLEHCPHHHPVAIIAWLLILVLGFNLFEVFVRLHGKLWPSGKVSLQELAMGLDRALEHPEELTPLWSG
jgi:hypothetical protein